MTERSPILDFFPFTPTPSQARVIDKLDHFLRHGEEDSLFLLRGYAGTGKSSLVGAWTRMLVSMGVPVRLLAPTGRAAKVLSAYCGMPAYTIHRTIYRQRVGAGGAFTYDLGYNAGQQGTVFVVDEASMISNQSEGNDTFGSGRLLDDLMDFCHSVPYSRIVLIGDDAQLPPVGTPQSPALSPDYLRGYCSYLYEETLTDIVRQESAGEIVLTSYDLRQRIADLQQGKPWSEPLLETPRRGGEVRIISGYDLPELMEESYRRVGQEETVLITRSNREAESYNQGIRHRTLSYEEEVVPGERLMVVRNNYFYTPVDSAGKQTGGFIANGEILEVRDARHTAELYGFTFRDAELIDGEGGFVSAKILLESLYSGTSALTGEQRQLLFDNVALDYPGVQSRRQLYAEMRKNPYLNALQIKYAYAMTCNKAQGGQWREVFVSFGYLTPEMIDISFLRWFYTAVTRATERLYLIDPPAFIFGQIEEEAIQLRDL